MEIEPMTQPDGTLLRTLINLEALEQWEGGAQCLTKGMADIHKRAVVVCTPGTTLESTSDKFSVDVEAVAAAILRRLEARRPIVLYNSENDAASDKKQKYRSLTTRCCGVIGSCCRCMSWCILIALCLTPLVLLCLVLAAKWYGDVALAN